ncbi:MAG: isoprenylcysteine carboxylmethyltransferase family protein [Chitinispirillaceae bacterium]|nr:isoprenylcysteine carboxylmethyltransferase family protein [Chitinispirillaceae bacterium]
MIHLSNAWILVVPVWLIGLLLASANRKGMQRAADMSWYSRMDRFASYASMSLMIIFMAVSFFILLNISSPWFSIGLVMVLAGFIASIAAKISYAKAKPGFAITRGIYRYSRNPMYASFSLVMLGAVVSSGSLHLFFLWILIAICTHLLIIGEERCCLKAYGSSYGEYMKKTPRYFLFL